MAGNTFTQAFVITKLLQNESNATSLLFLLDEDEKDVITKQQHHGIKHFMSKHFNQDNDTNIINNVFNRIILTFPQQYHSIISYDHRSYYRDSFHYYKLLFKQSDLIHYIFQYLDRNGPESLINCSLVDSIWLLNAFSPKCFDLMSYNIGCLTKNNSHKCIRIWERFVNIKWLNMKLYWRDHYFMSGHRFETSSVINGLKSINIEKLKKLSVETFASYTKLNRQLIKIFCSRLQHNTISNHFHSQFTIQLRIIPMLIQKTYQNWY